MTTAATDQWKPPPVGAFRLVNRVVRPLLRSPLHPLLSRRLMLLSYTGRRSGRTFTIPVGYFPAGDGDLLATSTQPTWAVNLRDGRTVRLRIRGQWHEATPTVIEDPAAVADLLEQLGQRLGPAALASMRLGMPADRQPTPDELSTAASRIRAVTFALRSDSPRPESSTSDTSQPGT